MKVDSMDASKTGGRRGIKPYFSRVSCPGATMTGRSVIALADRVVHRMNKIPDILRNFCRSVRGLVRYFRSMYIELERVVLDAATGLGDLGRGNEKMKVEREKEEGEQKASRYDTTTSKLLLTCRAVAGEA